MDLKIKSKTLGIFMLIISILVSLASVIFFGLIVLSIGTYITWFSLSMLAAILVLLFSAAMLYISIRYIKKKPFKKNKIMGVILISLGIIYFLNKLMTFIFENITGLNPGAWLQPIIGFVIGFFFVLFGLGFLANKD